MGDEVDYPKRFVNKPRIKGTTKTRADGDNISELS
jgi:hypothetical protein